MFEIAINDDIKGRAVTEENARRYGALLSRGGKPAFRLAWQCPDPHRPGYYRQAHESEAGSFSVFPVDRTLRRAIQAAVPQIAIDVYATGATLAEAVAAAEALAASVEG